MSYLRNHKLLLLIISILLIANIALLYFFVSNRSSSSHTDKPPVSREEMRKRSIEKVKNEVGLNDAQATQYDSLRMKQFETMKPLFEDVTKSKEEFFSLIYQPTVSDSAVNAYATRI